MRTIGAMPALALLLGAASALVFHIDTSFAIAVLFIATAAAWSAWRYERDRLAFAAMAIAFFGAAAALTADAQRRALDQSFGPHASPVAVRLRLLEDASPQDGFTTLQATVLAVRVGGDWKPATAGATVTVGGSVAAEQSVEWRAGRVIETFATFRRPARYLDEGVPDFSAIWRWRGRPSSDQSRAGWLVDVRARGSAVQEAAAVIRAHVRRSVDRWVAPHDATSAAIVTAVLIGDRTGPAGRGSGAAAGGGDVSRHRDLGRQHRDPRRARARAASGLRDQRPAGGVRSRCCC